MTPIQYALLNGSHILGLGLFIGATLAMDFGHLRWPGFGWTMAVEESLRRAAIRAFLFTAGTGTLLFLVRPSDYLQSAAFLVKVCGVVLASCNALLFSSVSDRRVRKVMAGLSILLWLSVLFAGRWIGFSDE